jgi:cysteine dioxygenase
MSTVPDKRVSDRGPLSLTEVRDALLALPGAYRRDDVHRIANRLHVTRAELRRYLHFSDEHYTRTRFYEGERFEILVLSWRPGQQSPIHDHANSLCTMYVLEGPCVTVNYRRIVEGDRARLIAEDEAVLRPGNLTTVHGGDIHRVANPAGSGRELITIHFYLPPIPEMLVFDEVTAEASLCRAVTLDPEPETQTAR